MRSKLLALCVFLLLALLAPATSAQTGGVEIRNAWARATPRAAQTAAVYATITAAADDRLTGASTPAAKQAQLHTMSMDNGVMKMRQVDGIDLAAGQAVTLKPGGYHIMLIGLAQPLSEGQTFPMTLSFAKAGAQDVAVTVQKVGAIRPGKGMDMPGMNMPMHH
jgi:periplasmic copper chaperone A